MFGTPGALLCLERLWVYTLGTPLGIYGLGTPLGIYVLGTPLSAFALGTPRRFHGTPLDASAFKTPLGVSALETPLMLRFSAISKLFTVPSHCWLYSNFARRLKSTSGVKWAKKLTMKLAIDIDLFYTSIDVAH
ncbi:Uncharacterized protein TCM_041811 [Theobroma cacao]|uniref:Uncharacterized protein n=1 Tax=Theobroma cacao TaxID=3641 RepID=A0A061GWY0_THECC|nr:Uncharacterized protein TCM_041811 [Theobroma cacao]